MKIRSSGILRHSKRRVSLDVSKGRVAFIYRIKLVGPEGDGSAVPRNVGVNQWAASDIRVSTGDFSSSAVRALMALGAVSVVLSTDIATGKADADCQLHRMETLCV
jgi:hypothetical protein